MAKSCCSLCSKYSSDSGEVKSSRLAQRKLLIDSHLHKSGDVIDCLRAEADVITQKRKLLFVKSVQIPKNDIVCMFFDSLNCGVIMILRGKCAFKR